jgi:hypothetical protein
MRTTDEKNLLDRIAQEIKAAPSTAAATPPANAVKGISFDQ